jgi:tetratricopeptide (TPR) repeat protein
MAKAAALKSIDSLSGVDARMEALDRLEQLTDELAAERARHKSNVMLKRGIRAWRKGDIVKAGQWALKSSQADASNAKAFHVLAMALERMGHLHKALVTYEHAFHLDPNDPELLVNLGLTAWNLKMTEGAAKMFNLYIDAKPDSPLGYNNLGSVQCDLGKPDEAIETLRGAIMRMPEQSILWNSLATVLAEEGRADESLVFYNEAARLEPNFARVYHNLGYAYQHLGQLENALVNYDRAMALVKKASANTKSAMMSVSAPICIT